MESANKTIKYLSYGSPLMDIIRDVPDEFIQKHGIEMGTSIQKSHKDVTFFDEFTKNSDATYVPGGCQFNAMRWLVEKNENELVGFLGSVGKDEWGSKFEETCDEEGIMTFFEKNEEKNTGLCLVVCNQRDRAHITDLGASTSISREFIERNMKKFKDVTLIFTELYILRHQKRFTFELAKFGYSDHRRYGFNLPCTFFIDNYLDDIIDLVGYADIVFSNQHEAIHFCKKLGLDVNRPLQKIIEDLAKIQKKNINKNRVFVITDGAKPAWVCEYNFKENKVEFCNSFPVDPLDPKYIIDTNGAGDSFAGGFLSQYVNGKSLEECMRKGHWAASKIIQVRGCVIPDSKYSLKL